MDWNPNSAFPEAFHQIALDVYCDDPLWIPEQLPELQRAFGSSNPYFEECSAWLGYEPGLARLAGFFSPHQMIEGKRAAYFGYWETMDQEAPNRKLFTEFEAWARGKGAEVIYGPINFTTFGPYRIRLNEFDAGFFPGEPYNPPHYQRLLEGLGYSLFARYMSYTGKIDGVIENWHKKFPSPSETAEKLGVRITQLKPEYWFENLDTIYEYVGVLYGDNFAYTGIPRETFKLFMGKSYAYRFCPHTSVIAFDKKDNIAGFIISFPDYAPLCRQGEEKPLTLNELEFEKHFPMLKSPMTISKSGAVHPDYRRGGLYAAVNYVATELAAEKKYAYWAGSTIHEDNPARRIARKLTTHPDDLERIYGLFAKSLR